MSAKSGFRTPIRSIWRDAGRMAKISQVDLTPSILVTFSAVILSNRNKSTKFDKIAQKFCDPESPAADSSDAQ